jgi:hypothetical protein
MLKTISAALLAVSVLVAPAFAAGTDKTEQAPVTKSAATKSASVKPSALNAKMGRHHVKKHVRHHRANKMAAHKAQSSKTAVKHVTQPAKRG